MNSLQKQKNDKESKKERAKEEEEEENNDALEQSRAGKKERKKETKLSLSIQLLYPVVSTIGVPSKFSKPDRPPVCSPESPERTAAGGKTPIPGNELEEVRGSAESATCDADALRVRSRRGK